MNPVHSPGRVLPPQPRAVASTGEEAQLAPQHGEAVIRLVETAPVVYRQHQFFVWSQGPLHTLLPHQVLVCGAYTRQKRALGFRAFQSVVLSPQALAPVTDGASPLMQACAANWVRGGAQPLVMNTDLLPADARDQARQLHLELGGTQFVVHGVARPQRPAEIESLFVFLCSLPDRHPGERALHAELVMPYLHAPWRRVLVTESEMGSSLTASPVQTGVRQVIASSPLPLTEREREILVGAREGKSNLQIGEALGISALTVKNHIQKILRKLGARNRAHAVALAMAQDLFSGRADQR